MGPATRHAFRLAMRTFYTAAGFFTAILTAVIAHDGLSPQGGLLPSESPLLVFGAVVWACAVVLDGLTSVPGKSKK